MLSIHFGADPVDLAVQSALAELADGQRPEERELVDLKEEAGRRPNGRLEPGTPDNEQAAEALAGAAACMANSPLGGALIVGVADDGALIGAVLDGEWLRYRIYQKLQRLLTVTVQQVEIKGVRLLVVSCPQAVEPIRWNGKIRWRVGDHCAEVDAATWHTSRRLQMRFDWSAQASSIPVSAVRAGAIEAARQFLSDAVDPEKQELAEVDEPTLLRRLNAVTGSGFLTNAAVLTFIGRDAPALDYLRRDVAGGDSIDRVRRSNRSILEQLTEVFAAARAHNPIRHIEAGLVIGQTRRLPERAVREAIVNGIAHRDWNSDAPTLLEHVGGTLRVTSPGGFFGGVSEHNIITHPSDSRNTALTEMLAAVGVAEREGVGVDRIVGDMLRLGYQEPEIREVAGPYVSTSLVSGATDDAWIDWLRVSGRDDIRRDLRLLMTLRWVLTNGWCDVPTLAPYLQLPESETAEAVESLTQGQGQSRLLAVVEGVPADARWPAYRLSTAASEALKDADARHSHHRPTPTRERLALSFANARGRISSSELASLAGAAAPNVVSVLRHLENEGRLEPSRPNRRGAGLFYRPVRD